MGGAVGANRTVPGSGAGRGGGARPRAGPFRGGRVTLARYSFRASEGGGAQGRRDAAPRVPACTRQVGPVSRPRRSLRGVLWEEEQTPSEGIPGVPLPSPPEVLGFEEALGPGPGGPGLSDLGQATWKTGVPCPTFVLPQRSGRLNVSHGGGPHTLLPPPLRRHSPAPHNASGCSDAEPQSCCGSPARHKELS